MIEINGEKWTETTERPPPLRARVWTLFVSGCVQLRQHMIRRGDGWRLTDGSPCEFVPQYWRAE